MTPLVPRLIVLSGRPGVGKSAIARAVSEELAAVWLRVDTIEAGLLRAGIPQSFETGLAAYVVAQDLAEENLRLGRTVVIDAVNGVEPARQMWRDLARKQPVKLRFIEVVCSDQAEHRRRVEARTQTSSPLPAPSWEEVLQREYLPWSDPLLSVDTVEPVDRNVSRILDYSK